MKKRIHSSLVEKHKLLSFTSCVICPGSGSHTGKAEGTFDASALPAGSAFNVFSSPTAIDLVDVNFSHTVSANEDLSILTLTEGQFTINAGNGDRLQGTYEDFVYSLDAETQQYSGAGGLHVYWRHWPVFPKHPAADFGQAAAAFTSATGGTADHEWTNRLDLPNVPIDWSSEGTFDASALPAGTAVNTFFVLASVQSGRCTIQSRRHGQ